MPTSLKNPALFKGIFLGLFLISFLFTLKNFFFFRSRFYPGTILAGQDLSRLTRAEAINLLPQLFPFENQYFTFTHEDKNYFYPLSGLTLQEEETIQALWQKTHSRFRLTPLLSLSPGRPPSYPLSVNFDKKDFLTWTASVAAEINRPFIPPSLSLVGEKGSNELSLQPGKLGAKLNLSALQSVLEWDLSYCNFNPKNLPVETIGQLPDPLRSQEVLLLGQTLLPKSLLLLAQEDPPLTVFGEELISWLSFTERDRLDSVPIADFLSALASSLDRPAQNAVFRFDQGKVVEFQPDRTGRRLDQAQSHQLIKAAVNQLLDSSASSVSATLSFDLLEPEIKTEDVNNLGIRDLLGFGESYFAHSIPSRIYNVERGSSAVNGLLIAPGEIFSFNQAIGEVSQATGYKSAYIIKNGRTELGDGGGVCQVSTTLFRAVLNAGLPIKERRPHAYRVGYYEQGTKPGFDATVFQPSPDLKFENNTAHHLLIQSTFDGQAQHLVYEIYGTSDGRQTEISNYRSWGYAAPPPALYVDDPTLPVGTLKQTEQSIPGLKTAFDWKVTRGEEVLSQQTFSSSYRPWQAVFLRGTRPN